MKRISCQYNIDTARNEHAHPGAGPRERNVEVKYDNGAMISIDCIAVENMFARNRFEQAELDYLVYYDPAAYAELVLTGDPEAYLKAVTEYKPLD